MKKIIIYQNPFFSGMGGEECTDDKPQLLEGPVGPSAILNSSLKNGKITHSLVCGDNYMSSHTKDALAAIEKLLDSLEFDCFVSGPAFLSGRYGTACAEIGHFVHTRYKVPVVSCMYEENPGCSLYPFDQYIMSGSKNASHMTEDLNKISHLVNKLINSEEILWAESEGYLPRGIRKQVLLPKEQTAARRALSLLEKKLAGKPYESELPITEEPRVPIAPSISNMKSAVIAFISTGGLVPHNNPDHILGAGSSRYARYDISQLDTLKAGEWRCVHGGIDPVSANSDPLLLMPLDALRALQRENSFRTLYPWFYTTVGNQTSKTNAIRMAKEITRDLIEDHVDGVIFSSC